MTSPRGCNLARMLGSFLWEKRIMLAWPVEHVAKLAGISVGRVMMLELCADEDDDLALVCRALNLDLGELLARATGAAIMPHLAGPWDPDVWGDADEQIDF